MRQNLVFETTNGNRYFYTESSRYSILLNPLLEKALQGQEDASSDSEYEYYKKKADFLKQHNVLDHKEVSFITKPDPQIIKQNIANTKQLVLEITDCCNLDCYYCGYGALYTNYDKRRTGNMSVEQAKGILDYVIKLQESKANFSYTQALDISFYGGEPLLNMKLIKESIAYLEQLETNLTFTYRMTTNTMLLDRYMDYLVEKKFNLLISLDGDRWANSYRQTVNGEESFPIVFRNALALKTKYLEYFESHVQFNAVLTDRSDYGEIYSFIKNHFDKIPMISELSDSGVAKDKLDEFQTMFKSTFVSQKEFYKTHPTYSKDFFAKEENATFRSFVHGNTGNTFLTLNDLLKKEKSIFHMPSGTCMAFNRKIFVTINGKVLPCEKIGQETPLGDVKDNRVDVDFDNVSMIYDKMYKPMLKMCQQCYSQDNCGQCVFHIYAKGKMMGKLFCPSFVNKARMQDYLQFNVSNVENDPHIYSEILEKDLLI